MSNKNGKADALVNDGNPVSLKDLIIQMAAQARLDNRLLSVCDVRYTTAGIPSIIADSYIYFKEGWEIGKTGKLGGTPEEAERIPSGGKIVCMSAVISVDLIQLPKA